MFCADGFKSGHKKGAFVFKIIGYSFLGIIFAVIFAFVFSILVMHIWNHLMPDIFGLKTITFWQAFLMIILAKLFFGHFGHSHPKHPHEQMKRKFKNKFCDDNHPDNDDEENKKYYEHYRNFWEEEGKKAFDEYVKKHEK